MLNHERLVEAYEDARFALLMEGVAQREGAQLEALCEQLQNDPEAAVPETLDTRCVRTIRRHFLKQKRRGALQKTGRVFRLAAIVAGISALLLTSVCAVSEKARLTTMNLLLSITEQYTSFTIENASPRIDSGGRGRYFPYAELGWIPEGFVYQESKSNYDSYAFFENDQGEFFIVCILPGTGSINIDTENTDSTEWININGNNGICVQKNGEFEILMTDLENGLYYEIGGSMGVTLDAAYKIVENIVILDTPASGGSGQYIQNVELGWIPEGFAYVESKSQYYRKAVFEDGQGNYFCVRVIPWAGTGFALNTENADSVQELTINGMEGFCVVKNGEFEIMLADLENRLLCEVGGTMGVTLDTAYKIIENIVILDIPASDGD